MIIISNGQSKIQILKHVDIDGSKTIEFINNMTDKSSSYDNLTEKQFMYEFDVPTGLKIGEYTYNIYCDDTIIETGLLSYGNINEIKKEQKETKDKEYNEENKQVYIYERN